MASFWIKIFLFPLVLIFMSGFTPGFTFLNLVQPIALGLIIAVISVGLDYYWTGKYSLWFMTLIDFVVFVLLIEASNIVDSINIFPLATVLTGLLLAIGEFVLHRYLIRRGDASETLV